ncbi:MAG: hypothetical protein U5R49_24515 [Deltaproteobacteria bacterium]|nr:hypothetical protein [Deltaproteobacteria bacterium]
MMRTFEDGKEHTAERAANTSKGVRILKIRTAPLTDESGATISVHETVEEGDMARLRELIGRTAQVNADTAKGLERLAEQYDYERLTP